MCPGVVSFRISSPHGGWIKHMYKEFTPGDFGNLRLPRDHIVRTRELRYEGEAHDQTLPCEAPIIIPGRGGPPRSGHLTSVG